MIDTEKFWVGTSWKMNKTLADAEGFATALAASQSDPRIQRFIIPAFTAVRQVKALLADTDIKVGAQNMHWADDGAWTGEISPVMLTDCSLDIVELGHSERRAYFGETNESVGLKTESAVRHGLTPLICLGETADEKLNGNATDVLRTQVEAALSLLSTPQHHAPILLAYEPVWAIGAQGKPATPEYADEQQAHIIDAAQKIVGRALPCLYGGSVNPDNCAELTKCPHIDGLFIGRSAWQLEGYLDILSRCKSALTK